MDLKEFVLTMLNANNNIFVEHIAINKQEKMLVYSKRQVHIKAEANISS